MGNIISAARPNETDQTVTDKNPGTYVDLHKKCKDIFPQCCKGAEVGFGNLLSSHLQVYHKINLSPEHAASGYKFRAVYTGTKEVGRLEDSGRNILFKILQMPTDTSLQEYQKNPGFSDIVEKAFEHGEANYKPRFPLLQGEIDASGNLETIIMHALTQKIRSTIHTKIQDNNWEAMLGNIDYRGSDFTASLFVDLNPIYNTGFLATRYLQKITSRLLLGAELVCQYGPGVPGRDLTGLSVATKLTGDKWTLSGIVKPAFGGAHFCYHHQITENLEVGAEIETSLARGESLCKLAYHLNVPEGSLKFRGSVDTNWEIEATLETTLLPFPYTLTLSGMASLAKFQKPEYRFGIGLLIFQERQVLDE